MDGAFVIDETTGVITVGNVDEIATNVISYAYADSDEEGGLMLWAEIDEKVLKIIIEDAGKEYDPTEVIQAES